MKNVNVHPNNLRKYNLPTVMGLIELVDPKTGFPVAVMDGTWITNMRTGAAGGVATKYLARDDSEILGLVGAGMQAFTQLMAIKEVMDIKEVKVSCRTCTHRANFAKMITDNFGINAKAVDTIKEAIIGSDVISTTTTARVPVIKRKWVANGTHINAMGADAPGKQELDPLLLKRARVFVDDLTQAVHSGEINVPVSRGFFSPAEIAGTIGEVVIGMKRRERPDQITLFDSTGLAIQDLAIASIAMRNGQVKDLPFP